MIFTSPSFCAKFQASQQAQQRLCSPHAGIEAASQHCDIRHNSDMIFVIAAPA